MAIQNLNWESLLPFPSPQAIAQHNATNTVRSPYIFGWFAIPDHVKYTEYAVDFKADHLPQGTYCSLGNWFMDYSMVDQTYGKWLANPAQIHAYAGFQHYRPGEKLGIMSFWDVSYQDAAGAKRFFRAKREFPTSTDHTDTFGGEGTGAHCLVPYPWQEKHWYRMHLRCAVSKISKNTLVEQWVCDLETNQYTLLCSYDVGVKGSAFKGPICVFLENFLAQHAGDVRTLEVRNVKYRDAATQRWVKVKEATFASDSGLPKYLGRYNFGTFQDRFWMITSGVGGDWFANGKGRQRTRLTIE